MFWIICLANFTQEFRWLLISILHRSNNPFINCPRCYSSSHIIQFTRYSARQTVSLFILAHLIFPVKNFFQLFSKIFSDPLPALAPLRRSDIIASRLGFVNRKFHFFSMFFLPPISCAATGRKPQNMTPPTAIHSWLLGKMHRTPAAANAQIQTLHFAALAKIFSDKW